MTSIPKAAKQLSYYDILDVSPEASPEQIRKAYRVAALRWHPDKVPGADFSKNATEDKSFTQLQRAWEVLKDPITRRAYDQQLSAEAVQSTVAVSAEVDLDELECSQDGEDGPCTFKFPCRCGGCYSVSEADLSHDSDHVLVQCQICSLVIKVLYTVAAFQDLAG